ncbi:hypothetical protein Y032_0008g8 [Ancylostoma ceylanicum]|nr:hypothetical protein Y032_0008g8 [Ancylostoma ceylanicum]
MTTIPPQNLDYRRKMRLHAYADVVTALGKRLFKLVNNSVVRPFSTSQCHIKAEQLNSRMLTTTSEISLAVLDSTPTPASSHDTEPNGMSPQALTNYLSGDERE